MWILVLGGFLVAGILFVYILTSFLNLSGGGLLPPMSMAELEQMEKDDISVYSREGYFARPQFTPDGRSILYIATTRSGEKSPGREPGPSDWENDIWIMDRDGTNQTRVTHAGDIQRFFPDPASGALAYNHFENGSVPIYIQQNPAESPVRIAGPRPYLYFSSWSPDGSRFVATGLNYSDSRNWVIMTGGIWEPGSGTPGMRLYLLEADGSNPREIALARGEGLDLAAESSWGPGGGRLAVPVSLPEGPGIGVIDAGAGTVTPITHGEDGYPRWSPDGGRIAFLRQGDAYTVSPDGSGERRIAGDGTVEALAWSPDGSRLAFSADSYLGIVNADGSGLARIANIHGDSGSEHRSH